MKKPDIEVYRLTQPRRYCRDYAHTDCVKFVCSTQINGMDGRNLRKFRKYIILDEVMDFERYNNSIDANCTPTYTKDDYPTQGINVIVLDCEEEDI